MPSLLHPGVVRERGAVEAPLLARFAHDDDGQDLIEYALLAGIAIAGILVLPGIVTKMGTNFSSWGKNVYDLWTPNAPK